MEDKIYVHNLPPEADINVVIPPAWAFGIIYGAYTNQEQSIELINQIIEYDYPIDAFWIDSWIWDWKNKGKGPDKYMDFVGDTISYPHMEGMWDYMKEKNIKSGMWMWDCILKPGNEEVYNNFKERGYFTHEFINTNGWHNGTQTTIIGDDSKEVKGTWCGNIDFNNDEAVAYFKLKTKHFFDKGLDFIKLDRTDAINVCKRMFEMSQDFGKETRGRGFILSHSNGVNNEEYKKYPGKWTDDTRSDWSYETQSREFSPWLPKVSFKENLAMYTDTNKHFHKIPFLANDMGGFAVSNNGYIDEELYIRWLEFAMFVPLTTPFSQPENKTGNIAFKVSERANRIFKEYAHLKMKLFPYIYSYAHKSRIEGINTIRLVPGHLYQYQFGEEILVAPVYESSQTRRKLYLPGTSKWINYWSGEVYQGGQEIITDAPLDKIPLFIKQGAIIPQRKYSRSIESGNNNIIELHIYPGSEGSFSLIEDDGISNHYLKGVYALTNMELKTNKKGFNLVINPVSGCYEGMKELRQWEIIIHDSKVPATVKLEEKELKFKISKRSMLIDPFKSDKKEKCIVKFEYD
ncbi:glycoside hydrolase family 31 protein [Abyssalbus ytuae]|uniref:DUF5110 domain-containing protein n=1 Tax=Abyssalbus ytuae TaxID=2926907 RepID=A0A9E6ZKA9_9FLAO|nr:TIM-barrel domain-containing protein [Abyssalbus ytuae]UOB16114.1 DUF5110 domain-containing protein [Abyssalbus ytuae]